MIRSATASSTRCREVFPSAGLSPLALGLELELELALVLEPDLVLALVLEPGALARGDVVVMGRFSPSGKCVEWSGAPPAAFWGERPRPSVTARALRAAMRAFPGFRAIFSPRMEAMGVSMPLWGNWVELRGEYRRRTPARALRAAMRAFPGFQGYSLHGWRQWAFLCPSAAVAGALRGELRRLRGRCGVEEDCRAVPAGKFRGCGAGI